MGNLNCWRDLYLVEEVESIKQYFTWLSNGFDIPVSKMLCKRIDIGPHWK
jgi:hypothetical protein